MSGGGIKPHPRSPLTLTAPGQTLGNATPYRKKSANRQSRGSQKKGNWLPQAESVEVKKHHSVKGGYLFPVGHKVPLILDLVTLRLRSKSLPSQGQYPSDDTHGLHGLSWTE